MRVGLRAGRVIGMVALLGMMAGAGPATTQSGKDWRAGFPAHWWAEVSKEGAPAWEILPQEAGVGEVILSKRNELGVLSNFAATPFVYRGVRYASVEGLWQMMKYPEGAGDERVREGVEWKYSREQVSQMAGFEAKRAGDVGEANMKKLGIDWVTFEGKRMVYRAKERGEHYRVIREAMWEKVRQNAEVRRVLLSTGDLVLRPDHRQGEGVPEEWKYYRIWMEIRGELREGGV